MIFITLGSQKFQFNRLLIAIDKLIEDNIIKDKVFAQIGYSDYRPQNYEYKDFLDRNEFINMENNADIIVTHGGTGAIIGALKKGKKVIGVPRLSAYGEHVDDHQLQIVEEFTRQRLIYGVYDYDELSSVINNINNMQFEQFKSNTQIIINDINSILEKWL